MLQKYAYLYTWCKKRLKNFETILDFQEIFRKKKKRKIAFSDINYCISLKLFSILKFVKHTLHASLTSTLYLYCKSRLPIYSILPYILTKQSTNIYFQTQMLWKTALSVKENCFRRPWRGEVILHYKYKWLVQKRDLFFPSFFGITK